MAAWRTCSALIPGTRLRSRQSGPSDSTCKNRRRLLAPAIAVALLPPVVGPPVSPCRGFMVAGIGGV
jgi:hypothetical protein